MIDFFLQIFSDSKKNKHSSCTNHTKLNYLCNQKVIYFKIIWFYLVRAEVVLWWHCLIFFICRNVTRKTKSWWQNGIKEAIFAAIVNWPMS